MRSCRSLFSLSSLAVGLALAAAMPAAAATAPNGNVFEVPAGWTDGGTAWTSGPSTVTARVDPVACAALAAVASSFGYATWATMAPWTGWQEATDRRVACTDIPRGALVLTVVGPDPQFNRYLPLFERVLQVSRVAGSEPVDEPDGMPGFTDDDDGDDLPIVGGLALFGTFGLPTSPSGGAGSPAGGGLLLHFTGPERGGPFLGIDSALGVAGGFLYQAELRLGIGFGGGPVHAAAYAGGGVDGVTSKVRASLQAPVGVTAFVALARRLTLELGGEARWYTAGRRGNPDGIAGFDEFEASGALWFPRRSWPPPEEPAMGLWLGGSFVRRVDSDLFTVVIGTGEVELP